MLAGPDYYAMAALLGPTLLGLRILGLDVDALARKVGLSVERLREPEARVPFFLRRPRLPPRLQAVDRAEPVGISLRPRGA